mgnify:CR=1 FL=1
MNSAKVYLKSDVFSRLHTPASGKDNEENQNPVGGGSNNTTTTNDGDDSERRSVMDMETFMTNVGGGGASGGGGGGRSTQTPQNRRPLSAGRSRPQYQQQQQQQQKKRPSSARKSRPSASSNDPNSATFHAFLARQNHTEMMKQKKMEKLAAQQEHKHEPELCETTKAMTEGRQTSDFLKRIKQYQVRKEHQSIRLKAQHSQDPECSFKPQLTEKSNELAEGGRSVVELSRGDMLRKETTQKLLRLRREQDELATLTFAPNVTHKTAIAKNADSKIKIHSDPDSYLERLQKDMKKKKTNARLQKQAMERRELEECTFTPQTSECPGYIKRIARSMALTKQTQIPRQNAKAEWR